MKQESKDLAAAGAVRRDPSLARKITSTMPDSRTSSTACEITVALLTGGGDRPYAYGLATELISKRATLDIIGGDELDDPKFQCQPTVRFFNLRGDHRPNASLMKKVRRVARYYARLIRYAATASPRIFHILWNNKLETFDRTLLTLYYKALGKRVVLTVHNVNAQRRDKKDTLLNRLTLRIQYRLVDHIFVHTEQMKRGLSQEFGVKNQLITVIPFGINNALPITQLTRSEARQRLAIREGDKTILFFGNIAPYKGLEYLVGAFQQLCMQSKEYRLIIAGRPKDCPQYWNEIRTMIRQGALGSKVLVNATYIPDEDTEVYFKAADVLVLPYRYIYQSGVLFLGYSFGLPVLAADVGSLKNEIAEGKTGFVFRPEDPINLAKTIEHYFASPLFANLDSLRHEIREYAEEVHSWDTVGEASMNVYARLLRLPSHNKDGLNEVAELKDRS
jgi:glycosyltransferase involved in cell wall biosynthesis